MKIKTQAAQAAANLRKELKAKFSNIKFRVTSENYSGGSSLTVYAQDIEPITAAMIESLTNKYQYGYFDSMNDIYEYSNRNDELPQVKYTFFENKMSDATREQIKALIKKEFGIESDSLQEWQAKLGQDESTAIWRVYNGSSNLINYWETR
jgi:hypothetical protein